MKKDIKRDTEIALYFQKLDDYQKTTTTKKEKDNTTDQNAKLCKQQQEKHFSINT